MYIPPAYKIDRAASLEFASRTVSASSAPSTATSRSPRHCRSISLMPATARRSCRSMSRAAIRWRHCADGQTPWLLTVNGPHAYVSPHWYASPDQVPTWLYQTVHLTGPARNMSGEELAQNLDALSAKFEAWLAPKPAWSVGGSVRRRGARCADEGDHGHRHDASIPSRAVSSSTRPSRTPMPRTSPARLPRKAVPTRTALAARTACGACEQIRCPAVIAMEISEEVT